MFKYNIVHDRVESGILELESVQLGRVGGPGREVGPLQAGNSDMKTLMRVFDALEDAFTGRCAI